MARVVTALAVVAIVLLGTWVTGGLVTDDFEASVALTTAFFAAAGASLFVLARRRPDLRVVLLGTFVAAAGIVGGYLAYTSFVDRSVDEAVARGPAKATATFRSVAHETSGTARVVGSELQLVDLATDPGPDLRVYVTREPYDGGDVGAHVDLGALKGNRGTQRYDLPTRTPLRGSVVIWCRAFSVAFGAADLASP